MRNLSKVVSLLFITIFTLGIAKNPVQEIGNLQVIGTQLSDQHGKAVRLIGTSFGWSNFHPRFYNAKAVKWLKKDWNVNVVRASMGIEPENAYLQNPNTNKKLIEKVIDGAIKEGIYVIIDWHAHVIHTKEAKDFFAEMAIKYGKHPNIIYEIYNEPVKDSWEQVKSYSEEIIAEIRKNDDDNLILVGCPEWDQRIDWVQQNPIKNAKNIMYTVHFYAGTHGQWLRDRTDAALKAGIPVFISESAGMEASGDGKIDDAEWQRYIDWMNEKKLSWITWSISDKKESCSMLLPSAESTGNWKISDLNESGIKTRDYLRKYDYRGHFDQNFIWKGRFEKSSENSGKLIGPASSVEFQFQGNSVEFNVKNVPYQGYYNYISVEIDGKYVGRFKVDNNDFKKFTFDASDLSRKVHSIRIYKATEAAMGEVFFDGKGVSTIAFQNEPKKKIEFIGDSITCGFGNDETDKKCGEGQWFDQHNAYLAYGPVLSRKLDSEFLLSSVSGFGMYRNWNTEKWEENILPDVYNNLYLRPSGTAKFENIFQPDLVSICLGTNDLSSGDGKKERLPFNKHKFIGNYIEFVQNIYRKYPNTKIVLLNSPMVAGEQNKLLIECLLEVKKFFSNNTKHSPIEIFEFQEMKPEGCGYHPSSKDDQKMADELFPFFSKLLN
ncbi:cellulase family glycosylhydrolase [Kaistella montana]|uniref:Cellulase family glycosylhydrolase n=1 Tax=Kaistella montana TaxID=1849733 RepID=A0ABW5K9A7_9FLAO|nr:cellulase family glycosylhydrolase [Kaistella montana]MCQ4035122.1 cellulase family glycosylhydrolase [Kaistella montana]